MFDTSNPMVQEILKRSITEQESRDKMAPPVTPVTPNPEPVSPLKALLMGSLADSASTYSFLKHGAAKEGNPALQYFNKSPNSVIPSAAAGAAGYALLYKLLHKVNPKIADTIAGGLGAFHSELAGHNIRPSVSQGSYKSVSDDQMQRALTTALRNK